jgi:tetratricopeptide (TPR) repeat protein
VLADLQEALLPLGPNEASPMVLVKTTLALAQESGPRVAREPLHRWIASEPGTYAALLALGHLALVLREAEPSEASFRRALDAHPEGTDALRGLGSLYAQTSRMEEALAVLERAARLDATEGLTHLQLGMVLFELGRRDEARAAWLAAAEHGEPRTRARARLLTGTILVERGDREAALEVFRRAVLDDPENASCHFNVGQVLHALERPEEAREHLARSIGLRPDHAHAHFLVGEIDEAGGRADEAMDRYRSALALDGEHEGARYRLSLLLRRAGRDEEADRVAADLDG